MMTSILMGLNSFASSLLSGLGLHATAGAIAGASVGETIAAGAGFIVISRVAGKICSVAIRWFCIFMVGMFAYRHFSWFSDFVNSVCTFIETYIPILVSDVQNVVQ
jgi:hypothetical protein